MKDTKLFQLVFQDHIYVIPRVNRREAKWLSKVASKYGIRECLSERLKEKWNYLTNVCVCSTDIGLHLMSMIAHYETDILRISRTYKSSIKEIKSLVKRVEKYHYYPLLDLKTNWEYNIYLNLLSKEELEKETALKVTITNKKVEIYNESLKRLKSISSSIESDLNNKEPFEKKDVIHCLDLLFGEYRRLETSINDLHMVKVGKNNKTDNKDIDVNNLLDEIKTTFILFNNKIRVDGSGIAQSRYKDLDQVPESAIGNKNENDWDYKSVLNRLLVSIKELLL